jgi:tetratricopeptide (TPR) repeat protein
LIKESEVETGKGVDRKRNRLIIALATLVVLLVSYVLVLFFRTGIGAWPTGDRWPWGGIGRGVSELPGVRLLLSQLNLGWAGIDAKGRQLLQRGAELEAEERYREAEQLFKEARDLMPDRVEPYLALASVYEALGEWDDAMEQLEKAVELDPENASAQRGLGRMHCLRGENEACIEALEKAVELAPDDPLGRYWLGLAYQRVAQDGQQKAEEQFFEALRLEPDLGRAHLALGSLYRGQPGQEARSFEELQRALSAAVETGDEDLEVKARTELAVLYYGQDNYDQCVEEWLRVLEEYPEDADARRRLGLCYAMRRNESDLERAIAELEMALKLDFEQMDAYYFYLGQYYASQEDYPRAFLAWDQFLRFSDNEELKDEVRGWIEHFRQALQEETTP